MIIIIFAPLSLPFSCVVVAPPAGHRNVGLVFQALCPCFLLFFSFFLAFRLVLSCRTSVGTSPRYVIGLIVPANSTLVPSRIGLRPVLMYEVFCCVFILSFRFLFSFWPFFAPLFPVLSSPLFRMYACTTAGYVTGVISQQVIRDRVRQVVLVPLPLRTGIAVHVLFCLLSFHRDVYCRLFCDHGMDFRKMSYRDNIVIINSSTLTPHAQMQGGNPAGHDSSALARS